jgi:dolichyl-phosphate-mannose-protein mannosyltransferase
VTVSNRAGLLGAPVALAIVALFCALLSAYHVASYDGVDENGYLITAKSLATRGDSGKVLDDPNEFVSGNYVLADNGNYYGKYPLGYPALCTLAYKLGGPSAVFLVNPILAALAVLGIFLLGRAMMGEFAGALAAILLATNPLHAYFGNSALSHSGSICFAVWGMFFLWRWTEVGGKWNAFLAGAISAYASTVRYTDGLLILPIVAMVLCRWFKTEAPADQQTVARRKVVREFIVMTLAAIITVTPLLIHHWKAFGAPWVTGYSLCGESTGFGWNFFKGNWFLMLTRMDTGGLILLFPLGLVGLAYLATHDARRGLFLGLWAVPALFLYSAYYWAPQGDGPGYVRFFVSVFPPLILSALTLLCYAVRARPWWEVGLGAFVAVVATANLREATHQLNRQMDRLVFDKETSDRVRDKLQDGAVIVANDRLLNFVEFAGDYHLYSSELFDRGAIQNRIKELKDNDPRPFQRRKAEKLAETQGKKSDSDLTQEQRDLINQQLKAGREVAMILPKDAYRRARGRLGDKFEFDPLTEWTEIHYGAKDTDLSYTAWALYRIKPRSSKPVNVAELEQQIDELDARLRDERADFDARFPGGQAAWARVQDTEHDLRDLREKLKKATPKPSPPPIPKPAMVATNAPVVASAPNPNEVKK